MSIRHVPYHQINKLKWDTCIRNSFNGLIYAYSWFLDIACESWDALVEDDYERVMPLPFRNKWMTDSVYQPLFINQLGIFSVPKLSQEKTGEFIDAIPERFKLMKFNLNRFNNIPEEKYRLKKIGALGMDLIQDYQKLEAGFNETTKTKIKEAGAFQLRTSADITPKDFVTFIRHYGKKIDELDAMRLRSLLKTLKNLKVGEFLGIFTDEDKLVAAGFFVSYLNSASLLAFAESPKGKKHNAMYWLTNSFLQSNARKNVTLDFPAAHSAEHNELFTGFGCKENSINQVSGNALPKPIKYLFA